jgi:hypothetical protein
MFELPHNIRISAVHELMRRLFTRSRQLRSDRIATEFISRRVLCLQLSVMCSVFLLSEGLVRICRRSIVWFRCVACESAPANEPPNY